MTKNCIHTYTHGDFFLDDTTGKETLVWLLSQIEGEFLLMAELRLTEEGYISAFNSHPFHFLSRNGYEGYLFYNGLLDYQKLAQLEGIDYNHYDTKNGTTLMGISIARELESGKTMQEAIEKPKEALRSAYNLMLFYRDNRWKYKAHIHAYLHDDVREKCCVQTYNKLLKKQDDDLLFIGASAIEHYLPQEYTILENAQNLDFDIDFIKEYYFDAKAQEEILF